MERARETQGKADAAAAETAGAAQRRPLLVAIGSSAGGLEALTAVLASLPVELDVAYVVA